MSAPVRPCIATLALLALGCSSSPPSEAGGPGGAAPGGAGGSGGAVDGGGGAGGAAAPDAGGALDAAAPRPLEVMCAGVKAIVCEDFEQDTLGAPPKLATVKTLSPSTGSIVVDEMKPFSGDRSVRITFEDFTTKGEALLTFDRGTYPGLFAENAVHGRARIYLRGSPPGVIWDFITARNLAVPPEGYSVSVGETGYLVAVSRTPIYARSNTATLLPTSAWTCLQWESDGSNAFVRMKVNGMPTMPEKAMLRTATFQVLEVGFRYSGGAAPMAIKVDLWIDDLAFGAEEIPCPPPRP